MRGAAHLAGRNPNLPKAMGNRPGLGGGHRLPGQSQASVAPVGQASPAGGPQPHGSWQAPAAGEARTDLRLRAGLGCKAYVSSTARPSPGQEWVGTVGQHAEKQGMVKNTRCLVSKANKATVPRLCWLSLRGLPALPLTSPGRSAPTHWAPWHRMSQGLQSRTWSPTDLA